MSDYKIVDIDYYEKDAILKIEDMNIYFQFSGEEPTFTDAIRYLINEVKKKYDLTD